MQLLKPTHAEQLLYMFAKVTVDLFFLFFFIQVAMTCIWFSVMPLNDYKTPW